MEASVRPPETQLWRHYDVISYHWVSKLAYFVEHDKAYQLFKVSMLYGVWMKFYERDAPPPPVLHRDKKPNAYMVNIWSKQS